MLISIIALSQLIPCYVLIKVIGCVGIFNAFPFPFCFSLYLGRRISRAHPPIPLQITRSESPFAVLVKANRAKQQFKKKTEIVYRWKEVFVKN